MKDIDFLSHEPYFNPKTVDVSIEKSNIKSKENTYYARVCKKGRVNTEKLLSILKEKATYIDINMMKVALEKLEEIIFDLVSEGQTVDFLNLGSFSLSCEGKVEIKEGMSHYVDESFSPESDSFRTNNDDGKTDANVSNALAKREEYIEKKNGDFNVSKAVLRQPKFKIKFAPSVICKKRFEDVKMAIAIKKRRAPLIKTLVCVTPESLSSTISMIKIEGENLKVLGDKKEVGIYIREENGRSFKVEKDAIIQNEPKTLTLLLNNKLKKGATYNISLITQYAKMGSTSTTKILKGTSFNFTMDREEKMDAA